MIDKLQPDHIIGLDGLPTTIMPDSAKLMRKINEIIDWIDDVSALRVTDKQVTANLPNIDAGELAFLSKENSDLEDELERTRKALEWARHFLKEIRLRYLTEKDEPSRQNKWVDTALYMYNCAESFFDDYDKTNETKGGNNE